MGLVDDEAIRAVVKRLTRPHPSGGRVIERAAVLAEGSDSAQIMAWITAHAGEPEAVAAAPAGPGLHAERHDTRSQTPMRFVLPASALQ